MVQASNALYIYPDVPIEQQLSDLTIHFSNDERKLVRFNQAKIYVDGILSLSASALKEPTNPAWDCHLMRNLDLNTLETRQPYRQSLPR
jgi:hypothetical protein